MSVTPLTIVEPDETHVEPLNICLYGPAGNGKTVAACSAPGPILVVNADRPGALRYARREYGDKIREARYTDRQSLHQVADYLKRNDRDEQTVVVDPLGEIYSRMAKEIGGRSPTQQQWGQVIAEVSDFVHFLCHQPFCVVIVCHEAIEDSDEGGATRRPLTGGRKLPEQVMGMMDVVAYCGVHHPDEGPPQYLGQLVQDKGRRAKDSTGVLGDLRPLDLTEWITAVEDAYNDSEIPFNPGPKDETEPTLDLEEAS